MPPSKPSPVSVGDVVGGKYRIERELGQGGVGVVVQARHLELHQPVAIKILLLRDDGEQVARFMQEARAAVRLRSEHVAKVTDVGRLPDGTPYMVMEFLEGENLASVSERCPLAVEDATTFMLQACEGVAEAHSLGIVHRDLKPANLFLTRNARGRPLVKVLDFGIAKRGDASGDDRRLTGALAVIGSPPYMSPEQVRASRDVDVRSDIWSLGVSLYELLTGRLPFDGETVQDICARVLTEPPTPIAYWQPAVPEALQAVIERCLAKSPGDRFRDVAELAFAIEPFAPPGERTAERVREMLLTPPPSGWAPPTPPPPPTQTIPLPAMPALSPSTAETHTAFGAGPTRPPRRRRFAMAAFAGLVGVVAIGGAAVRFVGPAHDASATSGPANTAAPAQCAAALPSLATPPSASTAPELAPPATPGGSAPAPTPSARPSPALHKPSGTSVTKAPKPALHPESSQM